MIRASAVIFILVSALSLNAGILTYDKALENLRGTKYYQAEKYEDSEAKYRENSLKYPHDGRLLFNLGNAQYQNGKLEEAENTYKLALKDDKTKDLSEIYQNLGNVKFQQQDYKTALENYLSALKLNPDNDDARYNYELARRFLQQQQQQQQDQNKDNDQKDQEKQDQQDKPQDSDQQDEQDQEEQQQQQQKQDQDQNEEESQEQQQQPEKSEEEQKQQEDAERLLKALLAKEKEEMKKMLEQKNIDKAKKGKYW